MGTPAEVGPKTPLGYQKKKKDEKPLAQSQVEANRPGPKGVNNLKGTDCCLAAGWGGRPRELWGCAGWGMTGEVGEQRVWMQEGGWVGGYGCEWIGGKFTEKQNVDGGGVGRRVGAYGVDNGGNGCESGGNTHPLNCNH